MVIGREYGDPMFVDGGAGLKVRNGHADAEPPGFVAPGDDTAVVVAEDYDGLVPEIGSECPLAGAVKAIAVDDGVHISFLGIAGAVRPEP